MVKQAKALATKTDYLNSIQRLSVMVERDDSLKLYSDLQMSTVACVNHRGNLNSSSPTIRAPTVWFGKVTSLVHKTMT